MWREWRVSYFCFRRPDVRSPFADRSGRGRRAGWICLCRSVAGTEPGAAATGSDTQRLRLDGPRRSVPILTEMIEARDISVKYGTRAAVAGVSLLALPDEIVALI